VADKVKDLMVLTPGCYVGMEIQEEDDESWKRR